MSNKKNRKQKNKKAFYSNKQSVVSPEEHKTELLEELPDVAVEPVNPLKSPVIDLQPQKEESAPISLDKDAMNIPPVNPMGVPGVMPIPDVGMNHNVMKQKRNINRNVKALESKNSYNWIIFIVVLLAIIVAIVTYFLVSKNTHNSKNNVSSNSNSQVNLEEIVELNCVLDEAYAEGVAGKSVVIFVFKGEDLIKTVDEESVIFTEEGMKYYSDYENSLKETLESEEFKFDNTTYEMKTTSNSITAIYTVDLTADPQNSNNNLAELGYTYNEAKRDLEMEGFTCK